MHEPMTEGQYVFSDSRSIIYRYHIDPENGKGPYWDKYSHDHRKHPFEWTTILQIMKMIRTRVHDEQIVYTCFRVKQTSITECLSRDKTLGYG